jgi:hypothetical protein
VRVAALLQIARTWLFCPFSAKRNGACSFSPSGEAGKIGPDWDNTFQGKNRILLFPTGNQSDPTERKQGVMTTIEGKSSKGR